MPWMKDLARSILVHSSHCRALGVGEAYDLADLRTKDAGGDPVHGGDWEVDLVNRLEVLELAEVDRPHKHRLVVTQKHHNAESESLAQGLDNQVPHHADQNHAEEAKIEDCTVMRR